MKRLTAFLIVFALLFLCACNSKPETPPTTTQAPPKRSDVLYLNDTAENYLACLNRYYSVISALNGKVRILEEEHNKKVKAESSDKFFLEENYIQTYFDPFLFTYLELTEKFFMGMNNVKAQEEFASYSNGMKIDFYSNNTNGKVLKFVSEGTVKTIEAEYKHTNDSLRYTFKTETDGTETTNEMLEFITVSRNAYAIQSTKSRCYIEFDKEGNILNFTCVELKDGTYMPKDSIFITTSPINKNWIDAENSDIYSKIHTYENGRLIHRECTSGPWKTISINSTDYDSAFIE